MKKNILFTGYIILVTVFFLYYLFPGDAVTSYINHQAKRMSAPVDVSINNIMPGFPPGVTLSGVNLLDRNQLIIGADKLAIKPSYLSLFLKNKTFYVNGTSCDGNVESAITVSNIDARPQVDIDVSFGGIQLSKIPALKQFDSYQFSGSADGDIVYSNKEVKAGKGEAEIAISDSAVQFTPALFGINQLEFKTIIAEIEINNQQLILKKLDIDSRDVSGIARGSIMLRNPINRSTLNITGEIKPHPTFIKQLGNLFPVDMISRRKSASGGIPFRITGSVERPNFSFR